MTEGREWRQRDAATARPDGPAPTMIGLLTHIRVERFFTCWPEEGMVVSKERSFLCFHKLLFASFSVGK